MEVGYSGQASGIVLRLESAGSEAKAIRALFEARYGAFGTLLDRYPLCILSARATVIREEGRPLDRLLTTGRAGGDGEPSGEREVWVGDSFCTCPVYDRERLKVGAGVSGPAVIEEAGATAAVPPKARAWADETGTVHIRM